MCVGVTSEVAPENFREILHSSQAFSRNLNHPRQTALNIGQMASHQLEMLAIDFSVICHRSPILHPPSMDIISVS
jgi:hypothetical protein